MQKVMFKGLLPEEKTLREIKVTNGAKIMVVGSTINDVLAVNTPKEAAQQEVKAEENKKEPLCRQKVAGVSLIPGGAEPQGSGGSPAGLCGRLGALGAGQGLWLAQARETRRAPRGEGLTAGKRPAQRSRGLRAPLVLLPGTAQRFGQETLNKGNVSRLLAQAQPRLIVSKN